MRLVLTLMLALTMMLSHGGGGEVLPHLDGLREHGVTASADYHDHDDYHVPLSDDGTGRDVGHATHLHLAGDVVRPNTGVALTPRLVEAGPRPPKQVGALASLGIAPLLEPPSA